MYRIERGRTPNGVRVVTVETPHLHTAMLNLSVAVGSRDETPECSGVSHFLEHILFRGCEDHPTSLELNSALDRWGGALNGATGQELTTFETAIAPEGIERAIGVAARMLVRPLFRDVELEREVILEEIREEVDEHERPIDADLHARRLVFGAHPLALPLAGSLESVAQIDEAMLRQWHAERYRADAMLLCVAGPVEHERVLAACARAFEGLPAGRPPDPLPAPPFPPGPRLRLVPHGESQSDLRLLFPAVPEHHADHPVFVVLRRLLDDGLACRLQQEIVEARGLAYSVSAGIDALREAALFEIEAATAHEKAPRLLAALLDVLSGLHRTPPSAEELDRVKARARFAGQALADSVSQLAAYFGEGALLGIEQTPAERVAAIEAVTCDDVVRVASEVFCREHLAAAVVGQPPPAELRQTLGL
ncbi:MAG: insulinase family protein [Deltaproteobacteria bacterium]|nr:MAG: insulinase family protein [Deltaproteobacteria bacterium]